jgi:hypothetical protein
LLSRLLSASAAAPAALAAPAVLNGTGVAALAAPPQVRVLGFTSAAAPAGTPHAAPTPLAASLRAAALRGLSAAAMSGRSAPLRFSAERPSRRYWRAFSYCMPGTAR